MFTLCILLRFYRSTVSFIVVSCNGEDRMLCWTLSLYIYYSSLVWRTLCLKKNSIHNTKSMAFHLWHVSNMPSWKAKSPLRCFYIVWFVWSHKWKTSSKDMLFKNEMLNVCQKWMKSMFESNTHVCIVFHRVVSFQIEKQYTDRMYLVTCTKQSTVNNTFKHFSPTLLPNIPPVYG